jgi:hypothetical protein
MTQVFLWKVTLTCKRVYALQIYFDALYRIHSRNRRHGTSGTGGCYWQYNQNSRLSDGKYYPLSGRILLRLQNPEAIKASETGFTISGTHKRVGMPETADIAGAYNEYELHAGRPITVMLQWQAEKNGVKASCGPIGSTFYPQAGKDYDVTIGYSGSCFVQIRELYETAPGKASARMAASSYSFPCAGH